MKIDAKLMLTVLFLVVVPCLLAVSPGSAQNYSPESVKRPVAVKDGIEMTRLADNDYQNGFDSDNRVAQFSPDKKHFVIILKRGDIAHNTNTFSVLLYRSRDALLSPKPDVVLEMHSSSNRDAISKVRWLGDNRTLVFLGENADEVSQVYAFDIKDRTLVQLTHHPSAILDYDVRYDGRRIVFVAQPVRQTGSCKEEARLKGIAITNQILTDLLRDPCGAPSQYAYAGQLFVQDEQDPPVRVPVQEPIRHEFSISLSPDGRYILMSVGVCQVPTLWRLYKDKDIQRFVNDKRRKDGISDLNRYQLWDILANRVIRLLDVPTLGFPPTKWASDGSSIILNNSFLPLDPLDVTELESRKTNRYDIEVEVPDGKYRKLENGYGQEEEKKETSSLKVFMKEDMNTPPKLYASDTKSQQEALLLDMNPQFAHIYLGEVKTVRWKTRDGRESQGGLYLPLGYIQGRHYPLVIQTHGFTTRRFSMDGLNDWASAFAARYLASAGLVVLQVAMHADNTPEEGPHEMARYEGAIDYLDGEGLIDRNLVGITGFSRTFYEVGYALTHSTYHFAAANLVEGIDGGYFQYLSVSPTPTDDFLLNEDWPFGRGIQSWIKNSPTFHLDQVHTPVRLVGLGASGGVLMEWEWFMVLSELDNPVDFILLPDAEHILVKPLERKVAQQGLVDWFRFWLRGEESQDPENEDQYVRWRNLRAEYLLATSRR